MLKDEDIVMYHAKDFSLERSARELTGANTMNNSNPATRLVIVWLAAKFRAMPIYEFHCGKCERDSEVLVRSSDWKGTKCPHCGSPKLTKKLSVFKEINMSQRHSKTNKKPKEELICKTVEPYIYLKNNIMYVYGKIPNVASKYLGCTNNLEDARKLKQNYENNN